MSTFNPIRLGEHAQDSYAKYLVGGNQRGYQGLLDQFVTDDERSKEQQLIRSKGPYLEGVPAAAWSDTPWTEFAHNVSGAFAPNGLEQPIIDAFTEENFEHLQRHQEEAIEWLANDKHALIAAGTGRGKTEAWFIPILQYALRAKRNKLDGVPVNGIKAVLTYPTKALAQDQLKRFIEYLWLVNEKADLPADQEITIGVYDGDTPYSNYVPGSSKDPFTYLIDAFRHFELPRTIAEKTAVSEEALEEVPPNVYVESNNNEYRLKLIEEYGGHTLDFVHLTRDTMHKSPPDIILTNPDTINYRLFNVNDEQAHRMFVDQPKFLVFDEVHTYEGLFGAHVSMLVKRLRRLREERGIDDPLRMIASSATIDEREELFQRLLSIPTNERDNSYTLIEEVTPDEVLTDPGHLPEPLTTQPYTAAEFAGTATHDRSAETNRIRNQLRLNPDTDIGTALEAEIADGSLHCLEHLHRVLQDPDNEAYDIPAAPTPKDFIEYISKTYNISSEKAEIVASNVLTLFELVGYEVRVHMFNWPVDGYYKCVHCHRIYSKPQACDCQGHEQRTAFVTKIRLCQNCGEQVYEAWYCSDCGTVRPVTQETEGEYLYATEPECNHPDHGELTRIYWTPEYTCEDCGRSEHPTEGLTDCECGGALTRTTDGTVCKNPTCDIEQPLSESGCSHCGGSLRLDDDLTRECSDPECEHYDDDQDGLNCGSCEAPLIPKYSLSWVCTNEEHAKGHNSRDLHDGCDCGRSTFVLPAYIDTQEADFCEPCNEERATDLYYLSGTGCSVEGHSDDDVVRVNKSFGLKSAYRDSDGNVRLDSTGKASHALPCYHGRSRNYDSLMRSPNNAGVTMSQFMLRELADTNDSQYQSKLMSFADSYRDMERMANDFEEPERELFIQQCILSYVEDHGSVTLAALLDGTIKEAKEYWNEMDASDDIINDVFGYGRWRGSLLGELISGTYVLANGSIGRTYGRLVTEGLIDISFNTPPETPEQRALCRHLLEDNRQQRQGLLQVLREDAAIENPVGVLNRLKERGVVSEDDDFDRVELSLDAIDVHFVGKDYSIRYDYRNDSFVSTAEIQVTDRSEHRLVDYNATYHDRASIESPFFTRTAYRASSTNPRLLTSQVYKGDVPADERRRIEHEFKHDPVPNFLSTGPAMEIGIDIGDLNTLLLVGTPPNTNAYLQRIGRAGRDAGKSLVTTISKRNPIDFYYHKKPSQLISSGEKPIPLDQHNEHVLSVSLTWAIMDYIAARYHVPWQQVDKVEGKEFTKPAPDEWDRYRKAEPRTAPPTDYETFTSLYNRPIDQIDHGRIFGVLKRIVEADEAVRPWLASLLDYGYCRNCNHIFSTGVTGTCPECGEVDITHAATEHEELIDETLEKFGERLVLAAFNYRQRLESERNDLKEEIRRKEDAQGGIGGFASGFDDDDDSDESDEELGAEIERLKVQRDIVRDLIDEYKGSSFADIHQRSGVAAYIPNIRSFSKSVNVKRRSVNEHGQLTATSKDAWGRDSAMALRELHPYAYVLRNKQGYVVTRVVKDTEGTRELKTELGAEQIRCDRCNFTTEWSGQESCPDCGAGPTELAKVEPIAMNEVEITQDSVTENDMDVTDVYALSDYSTNPRSTFAQMSVEISNFDAQRSVQIVSSDENPLFTVEYGEIGIIETVDSYTASYDSGEKDPSPARLNLCMDQDCGSIVVPREDGSRRCLSNPNHDPAKQTEVAAGRTFETMGIRLQSSTYADTMVHTFAHGLRLALQRTGGVDIRSLQESFEEGEGEAFVFESTVGGNGVTDLLFGTDDGVYTELVEALEVMHTNIDRCDCGSGCPECLYQYGCSENNKDRTFSKESFRDLLTDVLARESGEIVID